MASWLEWHAGSRPALSTTNFRCGVNIFAISFDPAEDSAIRAFFRFIGEALCLEVFLLSDGKQKARSAFAAVK